MNVEAVCDKRAQRDETEMKRDAPHRSKSQIEREKMKKWRCPMCGSDEWLCKVESYALYRICKQCGFESKEMMSE